MFMATRINYKYSFHQMQSIQYIQMDVNNKKRVVIPNNMIKCYINNNQITESMIYISNLIKQHTIHHTYINS